MKNIIVIGASSSLGKKICKHIKKKNFLILHTNSANLKKEKNNIIIKSNFKSKLSLNQFIKKIIKLNKEIDCIIHLPSEKIRIDHFYNYTWEEINNQLLIQLRSLHSLICNLIKNKMIKKKIKIISINSEVTKKNTKGMLDYYLSKTLLHIYLKNIKKEDRSLKVYELFPSMFKSQLLSKLPNYFVNQHTSYKKSLYIKKDILLKIDKFLK